MPLGVVADQQFEELVIRLEPSESLVFYTDGITEAMNEGSVLFGKERLMTALASCQGDSEALVKCLVTAVEKFCDARAQFDDICVTAVRRLH